MGFSETKAEAKAWVDGRQLFQLLGDQQWNRLALSNIPSSQELRAEPAPTVMRERFLHSWAGRRVRCLL